MRGQSEHLRTDPAVRLAVGLLLLVFFLRALIPAGFMPDAKALADGHFELVICTPGGPDSADGDAQEKWAGADCPYHFSFSQALVTVTPVPVAVEFASRAAHGFAAASNILLPPALGPPLGSRAPPAISA